MRFDPLKALGRLCHLVGCTIVALGRDVRLREPYGAVTQPYAAIRASHVGPLEPSWDHLRDLTMTSCVEARRGAQYLLAIEAMRGASI